MSYFEDLLARVRFFAEWTKDGPPRGFWLPGMFNAQSFLTGVLQNCELQLLHDNPACSCCITPRAARLGAHTCVPVRELNCS